MLNYQVINPEKEKSIVFITGGGIGQWMWQNQETLDCRLILFDLPGHGDNNNIEFTSIKEVSDHILEIIKYENIEKINLVGHSIGAQIIMYMMENHAEHLDKTMVISGLNKTMKWAIPMINAAVKMSMPLIKKKWFSKIQSKELALPESMFNTYYETSLTLSSNTLKNILTENMSFVFKGTKITGDKITFVVGAKEKKMMIKSALNNHNLIKGSHYICIENTAHGIPYEAPEQLNEMIKRMLEN